MLDIALNIGTWDLQLTDDLVLLSKTDQTVQHIRQRLQMFQGEWFLDLDSGVPWLQEILGKSRNLAATEAVLKEVIQSSPGVASLEAFSVQEAAGERTVAVNFAVKLTDGVTTTQALEILL